MSGNWYILGVLGKKNIVHCLEAKVRGGAVHADRHQWVYVCVSALYTSTLMTGTVLEPVLFFSCYHLSLTPVVLNFRGILRGTVLSLPG